MADPGASLPLDFAQAVLSVRGALAQKAAEIRELKQRRITEQILEEERLRIQEMSARLAAGTAQARTESEERVDTARIRSGERIAEGNQEIAREEAAARIKIEAQEHQERKDGILNNILSNLSQGRSAFIPTGMMAKIPPELLQGSLITEEGTGKRIPVSTWAQIPAEDGSGTLVVKLTDQLAQAEYNSLTALGQQREQAAALNTIRQREAKARAEKIERLSRKVDDMTVSERIRALDLLDKARLRHSADLSLTEDPVRRAEITRKFGQLEEVLVGLAIERWQERNGDVYDTSGNSAATRLDPETVQRRADVLTGENPIPRPAGTPDAEPAETTGLLEEYGLYDPETRRFRATSSNISRRARQLTARGAFEGTGREVGAIRKTRLEKGQIVEEALESLSGFPITRSARAPQNAPQGNPQAAPQAAPTTPASAGLTPEETARFRALIEKLKANTITPQEEEEINRLEALEKAARSR